MAEDQFESRLRALGRNVEWPPTPDFAIAVRERVSPARPEIPWWRRRELAFALAAAMLLAMALVALPPTRQAIAGWLGLTHVTLKRVPVLPSPAPSSSSSGDRKRVDLAEARSRAGFTVLAPSASVRAVYLLARPSGSEVEFELTDGMLVTESAGSFDQRILGKVIGPGTDVSTSQVRGRPGAWIHGSPHEVAYFDRGGNFRVETLRVAGNVLIWEEGGTVMRVEGASSEAAALTLAAGLH